MKRIGENTTGVLEFGGRFGTTTCAIAKQIFKVGGPPKVAVVEPSQYALSNLEKNLANHRCPAFIVSGVLAGSKGGGSARPIV